MAILVNRSLVLLQLKVEVQAVVAGDEAIYPNRLVTNVPMTTGLKTFDIEGETKGEIEAIKSTIRQEFPLICLYIQGYRASLLNFTGETANI